MLVSHSDLDLSCISLNQDWTSVLSVEMVVSSRLVIVDSGEGGGIVPVKCGGLFHTLVDVP